MITRGKRLLIALAIVILSSGWGWQNGIGKAEKALRERPELFANPRQLRVQLGARGATGAFFIGFPLSVLVYFTLTVFEKPKRS